MQQNQKYNLFYSMHFTSLSKPDAYITHDSTYLPTIQSEICVC